MGKVTWSFHKFYDDKFLTFLENRIRKTLKVDFNTLEKARGKYVRICVEVDILKALLVEYSI